MVFLITAVCYIMLVTECNTIIIIILHTEIHAYAWHRTRLESRPEKYIIILEIRHYCYMRRTPVKFNVNLCICDIILFVGGKIVICQEFYTDVVGVLPANLNF